MNIPEHYLVPGYRLPDRLPAAAKAPRSVPRDSIQGYIYFLLTEDRSRIKIGFSRWPEARLAKLQKWSPVKLDLIAYIPGDHSQDQFLQTLFAPHWLHYEWFEAVPEILSFVESAKQLGFLPVCAWPGADPTIAAPCRKPYRRRVTA